VAHTVWVWSASARCEVCFRFGGKHRSLFIILSTTRKATAIINNAINPPSNAPSPPLPCLQLILHDTYICNMQYMQPNPNAIAISYEISKYMYDVHIHIYRIIMKHSVRSYIYIVCSQREIIYIYIYKRERETGYTHTQCTMRNTHTHTNTQKNNKNTHNHTQLTHGHTHYSCTQFKLRCSKINARAAFSVARIAVHSTHTHDKNDVRRETGQTY